MQFVRLIYRTVSGYEKVSAAAARDLSAIRSNLGYQPKGEKDAKLADFIEEAKEAIEQGDIDEGINSLKDALAMLTIALPVASEIRKSVTEILASLSQPRADRDIYLYINTGDGEINWIEDGLEDTPPDFDDPTCTIWWKNGLHRVVKGTAEEVSRAMS